MSNGSVFEELLKYGRNIVTVVWQSKIESEIYRLWILSLFFMRFWGQYLNIYEVQN